jgi:radical SAM protein (TIGR01212 family)
MKVPTEEFTWRQAGLRYHTYNHSLRERFGERVQRVSIDAGFTCPNADGTVAKGGCVFCDNRSFSPSRREGRTEIQQQIDRGIKQLKLRYKVDKFLAYFQPATNTYGPLDKLRSIWDAALSHEQIVGLCIGTRADSVPPDVLDLVEEYGQQTWLTLELGMQTIHDRSLVWMNRGENHAQFLDAVERANSRGFEVCVHVILGIPGESVEDMLATADCLAKLPIDAVKIHNLYVVKNTALAKDYEAGKVDMLDLDTYLDVLVRFLEKLPPRIVVERISGDAPRDYMLSPNWCLDKPRIRTEFEKLLLERDSYQGKAFAADAELG